MPLEHSPRDLREAAQWFLQQEAEELVRRAAERGFVLTVEQVSVPPWASGRHETKVTVRPARKPGGEY